MWDLPSAVGTSLPELVTSITATKKGENDMAVGNVVGSNLFNVLGIIGISGLISPIELGANAHDSLVDSVILTVFTVICFVFSLTGLKITRIQGILLVFLYVAYMAFAILRNYGFVAI